MMPMPDFHPYYILNGHTPVHVTDVMVWGRWMAQHKYSPQADGDTEMDLCRVAEEYVGTAWISTVFLWLDHSFTGGPPILFETMVFGGELDQEQERYCTWEQAEAGHRFMVNRVRIAQQVSELVE